MARPSRLKRLRPGRAKLHEKADPVPHRNFHQRRHSRHWPQTFELVPSLQIAYVWHASVFTREVLNGLLRIGFLYPQQIIWNKGRTVLTRTQFWYQHEPCLVCAKEEGSLVWQGRRELDGLGFRFPEVHHGW